MNSHILQIASKYVTTLLLFFGIVALFRGHNYPGGGFIGGLLVGLAIAYKAFAFTPRIALAYLKVKPEALISIGLAIVVLSFVPSIAIGQEGMKGLWFSLDLVFTKLKLGTPTIFDIGVFLVVVGVSLLFTFTSNISSNTMDEQ